MTIARWRLQLIAELGVGRLARATRREEDDEVAQLKRKVG